MDDLAKEKLEDNATSNELDILVERIKANDNVAWQTLTEKFQNYIHKKAWEQLDKIEEYPNYDRKHMEEDLFMAGWQATINAIHNYDSKKGSFLSYASVCIKYAMSHEKNELLNFHGITDLPQKCFDELSHDEMLEINPGTKYQDISISEENCITEKYSVEERTLQILNILRIMTDESHFLRKNELMKLLKIYRISKHKNNTKLEEPNTITNTIKNILKEINRDESAYNFSIKYGQKKETVQSKKIEKTDKGKKQSLTDFFYVHLFSNAQLDSLIGIIATSDLLSYQDKEELIRKLNSTSSCYYHTPFWNGHEITFNPKALYGRFSSRSQNSDRTQITENIKIIQKAINSMGKISFTFNRYSSEKNMVPSSQYKHTLSPYHLVVYHDQYYCIGLKDNDHRIWHYRVDLMSDINIVKEGNNSIVPVDLPDYNQFPIFSGYWNPEKYMAEHLYMAYDKPQDIKIKIDHTDYTLIHDWFGDHYRKVEELVSKDDQGNEVQYDIVIIKTSPTMIVHWAMQYGTKVEVMNKEIREAIKKQLKIMEEKYNK